MTTTVGQILVNDALPPELRDYARTLGKDETDDILGEIARTRPDEYRDICKRLVDLGRNGAFDEGATITLGDLVPVVDKKPMLDLVRRQSAAIRASRRLSESEKDDAIAELYDMATKRLTDETYANALAVSNPFALQAKFKARGNKNQLGAMLTSPGTYTDSEGNIVPIFIGRSYAEGLRPHEYWAASYGARLGVTCLTPDTKVVMGDWTEREIGSLRPGDIIMGARRDGTIYPVRVKHFFDNGIQPVYRWTFRCLASQALVDVKATSEHKLLARVRRWGSGGESDPLGGPQLVRLGSAKFGARTDHNSYFAQVSAGGRFTGRHVDTALLLGLMTGDGCCSDGTSTRMSFSCADSTLLADIKEYLAGLNLRLTRTSGAYTHTFSRIDKIPHEWYYSADGHKFNNRARYEIWRYIGGCHSWDKKIPHDIMQWDDASVIAYMAGLFATDGSFYRTKRNTTSFSLALNSLSLVEAVKRILELRFGVWCSPVHDMQKSRAHHMYGLVVSHPGSFERLARLMRGVIPGVKRVKLEELHASKTEGRTPDIGFRIQSREYLGEQHVVDIEVDSPDHMFLLANGIISSNSTKLATQKGGYLAKMLNSASIDQVVTEDDCGTENGIPVKSDDADSVGSVLQEAVGGFKPGTVITKSVLDKIRASGVDEFMVRSPITCACKDGLCKRCVGIRETGRFPDIGYNVGITAASALGEQIAQNSLNCIAEGTLVRMADMSVKPIERIAPGEYVLGCGLDGFLTPSRVVARYDNGIQPCVSTRFVANGCHKDVDGPILVSTRVHPILGTRFVSGQRDAVNNFKPRVLEVGTRSKHFYAYTSSGLDDTGLRRERFAALLGALVGDGCYTESVQGVHLSCADELEISDLARTLEGSGIKLQRLAYHDGIYYRVSCADSNPGRYGNPVKNLLIAEGMYGKYAQEKELPRSIGTWDNASVAAFIGGYTAADGSIYSSDGKSKPGISYASTSIALLNGIRELLAVRFGILTSSISRTRRAGTAASRFDLYSFYITSRAGVSAFLRNIPIPGRKQALLARMVSAYASKCSRGNITAYRRVEQVDVGDRHVYDLEIDHPDHLYLLSNGLVVHNSKHSGKRNDLGSYVGFDALKNLTTIPNTYDVKASVARRDGVVTAVEKAPQGGSYVILDGSTDPDDRIYVPASLAVTSKVGDRLEAGDAVSQGLVSPADVVAYKGIGEGRRYFTNRMRKVFQDSKYGVSRRNVEVLARSLINNVRVDRPDSEGSGLPGDILRYSAWVQGYSPREGASEASPDKSVGRYLERPVMHYTVGTRITPNVVASMKRHGVQRVLSNATAPGVSPHMVSVVEAPAYSGDWMARLGTSYLKDRLLEDAQNVSTSKTHSTNPIPALAKGVEFGDDIEHGIY